MAFGGGIRRIVQLVLDKRSAQKVQRELGEVIDKGTDTGNAQTKLRGFFGKVGGWVKALGAAVAASGLALMIRQLGQAIQRGGEFLNVQRAFTRATGDQRTAMLQLRAASKGLISDYDLMVGMNNAIALGSARNAREFSELIEVATDLGRTLGMDTKFALDSLNTGIARQSRLFLDNLGIIVSVEEANRKYAEALGKTVSELTDAEKREAFRTEALRAAREATEKLGGATETNADKVQKFTATWRNLTDAFDVFLAKSSIVNAVLDHMVNTLDVLAGVDREAQATIADILDVDISTPQNIAKARTELIKLRDELQAERDRLGPRPTGIGAVLAFGSERVAEIKRVEGALDDVNAAISNTERELMGLGVTARSTGEDLGGPGGVADETDKVAEAFEKLEQDLRVARASAIIYGDSVDESALKVEAYKRAIDALIREGLDPQDQRLQNLVTRLHGVAAAYDSVSFSAERMQRIPPPPALGAPGPPSGIGPGLGPPVEPPDPEAAERAALQAQDALIGAAFRVSSAWANTFELMGQGFLDVEDLAAGVGLGIVEGLIGGLADYHMAQGVGKLAEGTFPPNPAALAAAGKHFAASAMFRALEGLTASASANLGSGGAVGVGTSDRVGFDGETGRGTEVHIYIDPLDPDNPLYQRNVQRASMLARERYGEGTPIHVHRARDRPR